MGNRNPEQRREVAVSPSYATPDSRYNPRTGRIGDEGLIIRSIRELSPTEEVDHKYSFEVKGGRC